MKAEAQGRHKLPAELPAELLAQLPAQLTSLQHQISLLPQIAAQPDDQTGGVAGSVDEGQTGGVAGGQNGDLTGDLNARQIVTYAGSLCHLLLSTGKSTNPNHLACPKQLHLFSKAAQL